jgi:signal transduction histidine kinase
MHSIYYILLQTGAASNVVTVAFGGVLVIFLTSFIILLTWVNRNKKNSLKIENDLIKERYESEILRNKVEVQEATFDSVGMELHDNVGQVLFTVRMLIGAAIRRLDKPLEDMILADEHLNIAIEEIRSLSKTLNREWLQQFDLANNLGTEVDRLKKTGIKISVEQCNTLMLDNESQFTLFRVIQEAVKNALRHSETVAIHIAIKENDKGIHCCIRDNGSGFDLDKKSKGLGIRNMKQRIQSMKGRINWQTGSQGTSVIIDIPVKKVRI